MVSVFSRPVLEYLQALHTTPNPATPAGFARRERTLYRWQRSLGRRLRHYPRIALTGLGLVHAHLFLESARTDWTRLPVVLSSAWVNRGLCTPGLYLHCAIPQGSENAFEAIIRSLANDGWCKTWTLILTGDAWQAMSPLADRVDRHGHFHAGEMDPLPEGALRETTETGVLRSHPFVVPAVLEAPGERCSLQAIWKRAYERLGAGVWQYFPRGTRRWPTNGKRYVRQALDRLVHERLFRQNVVRYDPLLDHAIEVFVILPSSAGSASSLALAFERACPVLDIAQSHDGRILIRATGDCELIYELLHLARDLPDPFLVWVHDSRHEAERTGRFAYETFFDPTTASWSFPADDVLATMRRSA